VLSFELPERVQVEPAFFAMWDHLEDRLAIAGDHDGLARFDKPGQSGQPFLSSVIGTVRMYANLANRGCSGQNWL
jgi:hypothetical protein